MLPAILMISPVTPLKQNLSAIIIHQVQREAEYTIFSNSLYMRLWAVWINGAI